MNDIERRRAAKRIADKVALPVSLCSDMLAATKDTEDIAFGILWGCANTSDPAGTAATIIADFRELDRDYAALPASPDTRTLPLFKESL